MSAFDAQGNFARCGERLFFYFYLIPGSDTGNQRGIPDSAESDSGLCPENPQPFEKGWRKLYFA